MEADPYLPIESVRIYRSARSISSLTSKILYKLVVSIEVARTRSDRVH